MERSILTRKIDKKKRKIVFLTGTRADFGKIKPLVSTLLKSKLFDVHLFVTGMHVDSKYGYTVDEIIKSGFSNIYQFDNNAESGRQDITLAHTLLGFSSYIKLIKPDMIIVHGDRVEALAGSIVGAVNNILVAHIEGGEISGNIDDSIRHSISKMSHLHFVANKAAARRLLQMGEDKRSIFTIGSPDFDIMSSGNLPKIAETKKRYGIDYKSYAILMCHSITSELSGLKDKINTLVDAVDKSGLNYVVIHPNNDPGRDIVFDIFSTRLLGNERFKFFPSMRFEHFLTLIKNAQFIIGNSSVGIRETPFYGIPSIDVGSRQNGRTQFAKIKSIFHCDFNKNEILRLLVRFGFKKIKFAPSRHFGNGKSVEKFLKIIETDKFWQTKIQKTFLDINF